MDTGNVNKGNTINNTIIRVHSKIIVSGTI